MPQPSPDGETLVEDLLPDLPPETTQMAREFKACTRARKINTPVQLLRVVLLYGGLDTSLREVAGQVTLLVERITDTAVAERLAACRPWVRAWRANRRPRPSLAALSGPHRCLVIDASGIQAPGARGTQYRLHLCMEMVTWTFPSIAITDQRTGESLQHFPLGPGDVAVADRGDCPPDTIVFRKNSILTRWTSRRLAAIIAIDFKKKIFRVADHKTPDLQGILVLRFINNSRVG